MNILFLCVANSARSQMAEGLAREILGQNVRVQSAGSKPSKVNPFAIKAMSEIGVDIGAHSSKSADSIDPSSVDLVITLCGEEVCPAFLGKARQEHWPFTDPAGAGETDEEQLENFRKVREQIRMKLEEFKITSAGGSSGITTTGGISGITSAGGSD